MHPVLVEDYSIIKEEFYTFLFLLLYKQGDGIDSKKYSIFRSKIPVITKYGKIIFK
jgi:hypothetical protein